MQATVYKGILLLAFVGLNYSFWSKNGNLVQLESKVEQYKEMESELTNMQQKNNILLRNIRLLKNDVSEIEELSRYKLGMIKSGETFYQIIEPIE